MNVPDCFKKSLNQIIKRAELAEESARELPEFAKTAYYFRFVAADIGIKELDNVPEPQKDAANAFLGDLLEKLELDRVSCNIRKEDEASDLQMLHSQALHLLRDTDDTDRSGVRNGEVVKGYLACGTYFDVLRRLNAEVLDSNMTNMAKYAKMRASEIYNALKEGRPAAPPPDSSFDFSMLDASLPSVGSGSVGAGAGVKSTSMNSAFPSAPSTAPSASSSSQMSSKSQPPPSSSSDVPSKAPAAMVFNTMPSLPSAAPQYPAMSAPPLAYAVPAPSTSFGGSSPSSAAISDATEFAKHAIAALKKSDVNQAADFLRQALATLGR
jgi:Vta1 like